MIERYKCSRFDSIQLNAKGAAATAGALNVRIIELEASALDGFDVIDLDAFQIHRAHLIDRDLEPVEIDHFIGFIGRVFKSHVVLETGAASADDGNAQRHRYRILHAHDFLDLGAGSGSQTNHKFLWPPHRRYARDATLKSSIANLFHNCTWHLNVEFLVWKLLAQPRFDNPITFAYNKMQP